MKPLAAPSPLREAALDAALRPFGESSLLPAEAYLDDSVFEWELRHRSERRWVCIGRTAGLEEPGAQRAARVGTSGVLVVRGRDGSLRAFGGRAGGGRRAPRREGGGDFVGGSMAILAGAATMSMSGRLVGSVRPRLDAVQRRRVVYVPLFPDLMIAFHPDDVMTHRLVPISPSRTEIVCRWLFAPQDVAREGFDSADAVDLWDLTNRQDWAALESVRRGSASAHLGRPLSRALVPADHRR